MLLRRLSQYADRIDLPPTLYSVTPIRYIIQLADDGHVLGMVDTADPASPVTRRGQPRLAPQVARAVGIKPLLLADNAEYTFGLKREASRPERVRACHAAYLALLERCIAYLDSTGPRAATTDALACRAVLDFLMNRPLEHLGLPDDYDSGALITFRVGSCFPIDLPSVQAFWAVENDPAARDAETMQCLVCGQHHPVLARLQGKVKGVPGGQTAGTSIISANAAAFESYGLEASLIAPTCATCGERFTKAANALLADRTRRIVVGGAAFVAWTREDVDFPFVDILTSPTERHVLDLRAALVRGGPRATVEAADETAFYATVLSASGGRAVVRDWIDTTVGGAKAQLLAWFDDQAIVDRDGGEARPLGLYALAAATVRDASKDLAPPTIRALLRAALTGTPLPTALLAQAIRRARAEGDVTRPRAALVKLVLARGRMTEEVQQMVQLVPDHPNPAYQCGRLLAVLDAVQRAALGGVNATIVDRYFGTASSAPGTVFPYLIRGSAPHLAKLRRDRPGAYAALQQRLEEVMGRLTEFRPVLTLEEQGLFALGFYHQRAHDREQARAASERRRAGAPATAPAADSLSEEDLAS